MRYLRRDGPNASGDVDYRPGLVVPVGLDADDQELQELKKFLLEFCPNKIGALCVIDTPRRKLACGMPDSIVRSSRTASTGSFLPRRL